MNICKIDFSEKFKKGERYGNAAEHQKKLRFHGFLGSLDCLVCGFFYKEEKVCEA